MIVPPHKEFEMSASACAPGATHVFGQIDRMPNFGPHAGEIRSKVDLGPKELWANGAPDQMFLDGKAYDATLEHGIYVVRGAPLKDGTQAAELSLDYGPPPPGEGPDAGRVMLCIDTFETQ